jgi:hypothetical protein
LQNIPENAGEPTTEELEAQYNEWLAAGGLDSVEEEIEAPLGFPTAPAAVRGMSTLPDFDEYVEPELVAAPAARPYEDPFSRGAIASYRETAKAWEIKDKLETSKRLAEARKRPNYQSMASMKREAKEEKRLAGIANRYLPSVLDMDRLRVNEMARTADQSPHDVEGKVACEDATASSARN